MADNNTTVETMPELSTLSRMWYADSLIGERTQISYLEEIPVLEEAPESITAAPLDINYEISRPGRKKTPAVEIPVYYTHEQHKRLKAINNVNKYLFIELPASTNPGGNPLVMSFQGKLVTTLDTLTGDEFIKDKVTLYRSTDITETDGFPTA